MHSQFAFCSSHFAFCILHSPGQAERERHSNGREHITYIVCPLKPFLPLPGTPWSRKIPSSPAKRIHCLATAAADAAAVPMNVNTISQCSARIVCLIVKFYFCIQIAAKKNERKCHCSFVLCASSLGLTLLMIWPRMSFVPRRNPNRCGLAEGSWVLPGFLLKQSWGP